MSIIILEFARSLVRERIPPQVFAEAYIEIYRIERDNNLLLKDEDSVSECLSSFFVWQIFIIQALIKRNMN